MAASRIRKARAVTVRRARPEDAPAIAAIHVTAWHETYTGLLPAEMISALTVEVRLAWWARLLSAPAATPGGAAYLAEVADAGVGFGTCNAQRADDLAAAGFDGEISGLYVLRAAQGRGVGRALMAAMAAKLRKAGHGAAGAWVLQTNAPACRFYESLGGTVIDGAVRGHGRLVEIAYGWGDLTPLAAAAEPGPGPRGRGARATALPTLRARGDG